MMGALGMPYEEALAYLDERGIKPHVIRAVGRRPSAEGQDRVIRVGDGGAVLTIARFPILKDEVSHESP